MKGLARGKPHISRVQVGLSRFRMSPNQKASVQLWLQPSSAVGPRLRHR